MVGLRGLITEMVIRQSILITAVRESLLSNETLPRSAINLPALFRPIDHAEIVHSTVCQTVRILDSIAAHTLSGTSLGGAEHCFGISNRSDTFAIIF
jgi:hypothetical protein